MPSAKMRKIKKRKVTGVFTAGLKGGLRGSSDTGLAEVTAADSKDIVDSIKEVDQQNCELYVTDWAMRYQGSTPASYLREVRGFSTTRIQEIFHLYPAADWGRFKDRILDSITANVVKRQQDLVAETVDRHVMGAKLIYSKAVEMMGKLPILDQPMFVMDASGKVKKVDGLKIKKYGLTSSMLVDCANSINIAVAIYRKSVGLRDGMTPDDMLRALAATGQLGGVVNNTQINIGTAAPLTAAPTPLDNALKQLTYDQIVELIDIKRGRKKAEVAAIEAVAVPVTEPAK